ncbi:MAG: histidine triad nucleotide-binding protein [Blastocatellales bacterium]
MSDSNCIFCKIVGGQIPATKVYEDDLSFAFRDINPQAPTHILLIPKRHVVSLNEISEEDRSLMGHLLVVSAQIAKQEKINDDGFRVIINSGADAGQSVFHIHLHVMGGRPMSWPPG